MSVISTPAIKADINANIFQNSDQLITGTILNAVLINIADSYLNRVTGGLLMQVETGYTTLITITDQKAFTHKKYVDDAVSGLLPIGTSAQYIRGDKTLSDFQADVRATLLTGLPTFTNTVISATDSVLSAFSNLQGQINNIDLSGYVPYIGSTSGINQNGFGITNSTGLTTTTISGTYSQLSSLSLSVIGATQNTVLSKISLTINETSLNEITRVINGGLVYQGTTFATTFLLPTNKGVLTTDTFAMLSDIANSSTETITAGENLVAGDLVYLKTDGKYWKADYLDENKVSTELRYVLETILANATGNAQITGNVTSSGLTVGERYCVGVNGAIVLESAIPDTEGIFIRYIGTAESATDLFFNPESDYIEVTLNPTSLVFSNIVFVESKSDLPTPSGGIITLLDNKTYFFTTSVDLTGDRLVCGVNTTLIGGSSENTRIKSTGLVGTALITSNYSLPIRNLTIEANLALNLDGDGVTTAIDWFGINFTDCANIGTIKDYSNIIMSDSAFLNSGGLILDGTIGTVGFSQCLFDCNSANTAITLLSTCTITRRFRITYSSFIIGSGETGINVNVSTSIPVEAYILDTVNFAGGGTYLTGVNETSNLALFSGSKGITNTAVNGQLYMQGNATATTVSAINTFYKIAGTTTPSADNSKFTHSNNRLTCDAIINRKYLIQATLSFTSTASNVCEFGFYDSQLGAVRTPSRTKSTANAAGRAESITLFCIVNMDNGDFIEVHGANRTAANNITVDDLNFIITEIK